MTISLTIVWILSPPVVWSISILSPYFLISYYLQYFFSLTQSESPSFLVEANGFFDWSKIIHSTDQLRALGGILYTEYKSSILIAAVLLFRARVGALAIAISLSSDSVSKGRFYINHLSEIKRQDANYQALRHPALVLNSFRILTKNYETF